VLRRHTVLELGNAESVVSVNKHLDDGLERLEAAAKAAAAASENRDVMPQVGVDALDIVRVALIVNIAHMLARKHHIQIAVIAVRGVFFSPRRAVYDALYCAAPLSIATSNPTIWRGSGFIMVMRYTFSRVSVFAFFSMNQ